MADLTITQALGSALSIKAEGSAGATDRFGPAIIAIVGAVVAICAAFGVVVPGGVATAATTVLGLAAGFAIRHQA